MKRILIIILVISFNFNLYSQDDLFKLLDEKRDYKIASTFKTIKIVNGQSVEIVDHGDLLFLVQHRFGTLNSGAYNLFGLDNSQVRFGLDYGLNNWCSFGLGRSSFLKTIDGNAKVRLFNQKKGGKNFPLSLVWYSSVFLKQVLPGDNTVKYVSDQLSYVHQILLSHKFNNSISLQLSPSWVHKNIVAINEDHDLYSLGVGFRYKLVQRISINSEYFYQLNKYSNINSLSLGCDIETGGHVFQLHITNSPAMFERAFIHENNDSFLDGDIYFGFNISRVFTIKR